MLLVVQTTTPKGIHIVTILNEIKVIGSLFYTRATEEGVGGGILTRRIKIKGIVIIKFE